MRTTPNCAAVRYELRKPAGWFSRAATLVFQGELIRKPTADAEGLVRDDDRVIRVPIGARRVPIQKRISDALCEADASRLPMLPPHSRRWLTLTNVSDATVQLVGRHWVIRRADGTVEATVPRNSPGAVGQKPVLHPGQCFEYALGATISSPTGEIAGAFQLVRIEHGRAGESFEAAVGAFRCDARAGAGAAPAE